MNKVASLAAVLALVVLGVYFFSAQPQGSSRLDNATPAGLSSVDGGSCCSEATEMVAQTGSCCGAGGDEAGAGELVSTGQSGCCAGQTASCCDEQNELVKTEGSSCCSEKTEVVATGSESKSCPCQAGKTEAVTTGGEKAECHGDCEQGCCQEKKAVTEVAEKEGGEGK